MWKQLFPTEQVRLVNLLIERVQLLSDGIDIVWREGGWKELIPTGQPHARRYPLEDGGVKIITFVPLQFKKRGIKKVVVGPAGVDDPVVVNAPIPVISPIRIRRCSKRPAGDATGNICWIAVLRRMRPRLPRGKVFTG